MTSAVGDTRFRCAPRCSIRCSRRSRALPGDRARSWRSFRPADRARRRAAANCRSAVSSADRLRRPAQPAEALGRHARYGCHRRGHRRRHRPPPPNRPRAPYNIDTSDDTNTLTITYFNARRDYLQKLLRRGETRYVSGTATLYDGHLQMVHPDRVVDAARLAEAAADRSGLSADRGPAPQPATQSDRDRAPAPAEFAGMAGRRLAQAQRLSGFRRRVAQHPSAGEPTDLEPDNAAWTRLAYDELLAGQLALALLRGRMRARPAAAPRPKASCARVSPRRCPTR